jgi:hypothetical protein
VRNLTIEFSEPTVANFNAIAATFNNITAAISWVEPEEPNGIISMYQYIIALDADPFDIVINESTVVTFPVLYVTVLAYARYRVTVTARTGGGFGTPAIQTEFSPEAGK